MSPPHNHREIRTPEVETVELLRVSFLRGTGCCTDSIVRIVTAYFHPDGRLLFEDDPSANRFGAVVTDAAGGVVTLFVDRDTESYPAIGSHVTVAL